jgi:hypothetical protein
MDANSYRNSLDVLRDLVICCDQYDSAKPASVENYRGALADARAFLEKHWDASGGPSREEVIEQCAEAVNLVRFNEAALHRKALTKAIEAIRALASTTATDEMAKVAGDPKDWSRNNQKWKDGGL